MKRTIATALVAFTALTGAASAMVDPGSLQNEVRIYAPNADVSNLTTAEVNQLLSIIHGGSTESEKRSAVRAIVQ